MIDVVYANVNWRSIMLLPRPGRATEFHSTSTVKKGYLLESIPYLCSRQTFLFTPFNQIHQAPNQEPLSWKQGTLRFWRTTAGDYVSVRRA
jgi:hypothetical protein